MKYTNELIHETSPYLLQHAHNPVHWYPFGDDAFKKAREENKMLIVSIGYAACHWCHVMEHESFENEEVAAVMNEHFISIKVDREERPDVDMIYMSAAQLINGSGGWPLNALALPDGRPFFAATYFPPQRWLQLLRYFVDQYRNNHDAIVEQAAHLSKGIRDIDHVPFGDEAPDFSKKDLETIHDHLLKRTDFQNGGLTSAMKFPMPSVWEWLLEYHHLTGDQDALQAVTTTLDHMKNGGIYDQIGGGFARYATDPQWHVPHFEKMLYDNAQLISLYSHAYQVTQQAEYKRIAEETIRFVKRELSDGMGFYASLDADSEKEEGKFYVWRHQEIREVLGDDADLFCKYFAIIPNGNWEDGKNIPDRNLAVHAGNNLSESDRMAIEEGRKKLLKKRHERVRPALDNKVLTSWNAMMVTALADAFRAFGKKEHYDLAKQSIDFLTTALWHADDKILYRNFQKKTASTPGFLDDYAFFIRSLIDFYQISFEIKYLHQAEQLTKVVLKHFVDESNKLFFYTDARFNQLITRPVEINDNVIPSSNSVMAENLHLLGLLMHDTKMVQHAATMVKNLKKDILANASYQSNWARVMLHMVTSVSEIAIVGAEWQDRLQEMQRHFTPAAVFCGSSGDENLPLLTGKYQAKKTLIYVCKNKACQRPVETSREAMKEVQKNTLQENR